MRTIYRFLAVTLLVLSVGLAAPTPTVSAANLDAIADHVFGQPDFNSRSSNNGGINASSLGGPFVGEVLDGNGNLYLADALNNRVLEYNTPLTTNTTADRVFGQPDFTSNTSNNGGVTANSLFVPTGIALDAQGNLYVADRGNNRVLEYNTPLTTDTTADRVFGQPDFTSNTANNGGISATALDFPTGVALDAQGNLFVAEKDNNRVLEYNTPLTTDTTADRVFGQPDFTSNTSNNGGVTAYSLSFPFGIALDAQGNLYVVDTYNIRVLEYTAPLTTGMAANRVFGQRGSFTTNIANNGGVDGNSLGAIFIAGGPSGVALDAQGNLYVADTWNYRVLEYDTPLKNDTTADHVFGQPDLISNTVNNGGVSAKSLGGPTGMALDAQGNLFVIDSDNNRVLEYDVPIPYGVPTINAVSPSTVAEGSPAFTLTVNGSGFVAGSTVRWNGSDRPTTYLSATQVNAAITSADLAGGGSFAVTVFNPSPGGGLSSPVNLSLYRRILKDKTADVVQGQPDFTGNLPNNTLMPGGANRLYQPQSVAVDPHTGRLFVADTFNHRVLSWPNAPAFANGQPADLVIGQPNFSTALPNNGGLSATSLFAPDGVFMDAQGDMFVTDFSNNRVLEYSAPLTTGMAATMVFGQGGSFTSNMANNSGVNANSLYRPAHGVALDTHGNLFVSDYGNNRVLEYDTPLTPGAAPGGDTTADQVFGQPDFISSGANNGGVSARSLDGPTGLAVDAQGNLYVADFLNSRVLEYDSPLISGAVPGGDTTADRVFGQGGSFTSNIANNGGISANSLSSPFGVVLDDKGNLYMADLGNSRVLEFDTPLILGAPSGGDTTADLIFGQPGFNSNAVNNGGVSANSLDFPPGLTVDPQGNLYVADELNNRVLEYDLALKKVNLPIIINNYPVFFLGPSEVEPNNDTDHPNGPLMYSRVYTGYHNDANDYFSFKVQNNFTNITLRFNSAYVEAASHFQIQLIQPDGTTRIDSGTAPSVIMKETLDAGTYYIYIYTDPGPPKNYLNASKSYTLEVTSP